MNKKILVSGCVLGILAIILGAFGAHSLKELLPVASQQTFEIGVKYQIYHALFLLFIGSFNALATKAKRVIFYLVLAGIFLFCGSIYGLSTNALSTFNFKTIAFLTPVGGLLLIIAWIILLINFLKLPSYKF